MLPRSRVCAGVGRRAGSRVVADEQGKRDYGRASSEEALARLGGDSAAVPAFLIPPLEPPLSALVRRSCLGKVARAQEPHDAIHLPPAASAANEQQSAGPVAQA